jgi:Outer membrane protein LpxR
MRRQIAAIALAFLLPMPGLAEPVLPGLAEPVIPGLEKPVTQSQERHKIGYGLLFTNDLLGDGHDRWRTGSVTSSRLYGQDWQGQAPTQFGALLELRLQGQIVQPANLKVVNAVDRPWAGALTAELNSHMQRGSNEISLGGGLAVVGPQTQLDRVQSWLHGLVSAPKVSDVVLNGQVENRIQPLISAEVGRAMTLSDRIELRPFVEARAGDETYLRAGLDLTYGQLAQGGLLVPETVTGQRYRTIQGEATGFTLTAGADIAYVSDSIYLPDSNGYDLAESRRRARVGLRWQGESASAFYGLTYLGKEFIGQSESQLTGSLQLQLRF